MTVTKAQYSSLDEAYSYFNKRLFDGKLPDCLIVLLRKPRMLGHFHFDRFKIRDGADHVSELALNPDSFTGRTDTEILSTLVHEMVHCYQYVIGESPRNGYHDKVWGELMKAIGLYPSNTGEHGGKETGQQMSHYIVDGGKFEIASGAFLLGGKKLFWESEPITKNSSGKPKKKNRYKFVCPQCLQQAWAKESASLACGDCKEAMIKEGDEE